MAQKALTKDKFDLLIYDFETRIKELQILNDQYAKLFGLYSGDTYNTIQNNLASIYQELTAVRQKVDEAFALIEIEEKYGRQMLIDYSCMFE